MVNFLNLPTVQAPRNALVDLSPIGNAIDGNRRNALMVQENARQQEELGMRKAQFEYQQTRDKKQDERADEAYFAKGAQSVKNMDPADPRRSMVWQNLLQKHPGRASLTPDYLDPIKGPDMVLAEYGALKDPRDSKLKDLEIRRAEAQINNLNQRGDQSRVIEVGGNLVRVPATGPAEEIYSGKPKMTPAQTALDKVYAKSYEEDIVSGGLADAEKNLSQLRSVNKQLKDPNGANLTGPLVGRLPDAIAAVTNPKAVDARERVEEVVQRNLRLVLGAQFTNEEGKRLIARAYNPALDEATNASRLNNLIGAMDAALQAKKAAAQYYEQNGTLQGFQGKTNFSVSDFENAIDGGAAASLKSKYGLE